MEHIIYDSEIDTDGFDFENEKENLSVGMDGGMIVIADLGLWDGRHNGYRMMTGKVSSALNAFQGDSYKLMYDPDTDDVKGVDHHHDGTNYYTFREVRKGKDISNYITYDLEDAFRYFRENDRLGFHCELKVI